MDLTQAKADAFFDSNAEQCPFCGSRDLGWGPAMKDEGVIYGEAECCDCYSQWVVCYHPTSIGQGESHSITGPFCATPKPDPVAEALLEDMRLIFSRGQAGDSSSEDLWEIAEYAIAQATTQETGD